jgi:hypothetical protein
MSDEKNEQTTKIELARLLSMEDEIHTTWTESDFGAILRHQLNSQLAELIEPNDISTLLEGDLAAGALSTVRDLLTHPQPPLDSLDALRRYGKRLGGAQDSGFPQQVAAVVYLVAICAAIVRCDKRISEASDQEVLTRIRRLMTHSWLDETSRGLLTEARDALNP